MNKSISLTTPEAALDRLIKQQATYYVFATFGLFGGSLLMLGAIALAAWWSLPSLLFITPAAVVFLAGIAFVQRTYGPRSWELGEQSAELTPLNADSALNRHENKKSGTHSAS